MVKRNRKQVQPGEAAELEHVEAEEVDYHISQSGKIEQTPDEKKRMYRESLIRTVTAAVLGILSGLICYFVLGTGTQEDTRLPWFIVLILIVIFTYYLQRRLLFPALKMDMKLLNWKDWFGIEFLVVIFCLVTWTILLNTGIL